MNIIRKLTREQFLEFVDHYYHGRYANRRLAECFADFYFQIDDPLLHTLGDEEKVLDHIEANYVEPHDDPHQLAA